MDPVLITVKRFGEVYGLGKTTTFELIKSGKLSAVKVGRRTLIDNAKARDFLLGESK